VQTETEILVIGGGIAGFSAALCAARLGHETHVLTGTTLGGHLISIERVEGYPGFEEGIAGYDLCPIVQAQATDAGAAVAMADATSVGSRDGVWHVASPAGDYLARTVILATGTRLRSLGVPGEQALFGKGVSHCASCDAPLLRGSPVVVVGGGDSAAQEALYLAPHASSVTIVHEGAALSCQRSFAERLEAASNIRYVAGSTVGAVLGNEAVTAVEILGADGSKSELEAAGVFVYIGLVPCSELFEGIVERTDTGHVVTNVSLATSAAGIFAAGTLRAGAHGRAAAAAGDGTAAALSAARLIGER